MRTAMRWSLGPVRVVKTARIENEHKISFRGAAASNSIGPSGNRLAPGALDRLHARTIRPRARLDGPNAMNATPMKLLGRSTSGNVQKVMWLLAELGQIYDHVEVGGASGSATEPEYLALNPNGLVPTLVDHGFVVWESNTILRYLCNKLDASMLYPAEYRQRSTVERWMDWQLATLTPPIAVLTRVLVRTPLAQRNADLIEEARLRATAALAIFDKHLSENEYAAGSSFTLADIGIGVMTYRWFEMSIARPSFGSLQRWYQILSGRKAYRNNVMTGLR